MKKLIMRIVAVISVFTIITATTIPAFATDKDVEFFNNKGNVVFTVPADEFSNDDYIIPYDLYLELKNNPISTYNAAAGVLGYSGGLALNAELAALGKTFASGGPYFLAVAALVGGLVVGIDGFVDMYRNGEFEQFYEDICTLYENCSNATKAWLEEAFELYVAGETITVPISVSQDLSSIMKGSIVSDGYGNNIDTSIAIPAAGIAGVFSETFSKTWERTADNTEFTDIDVTALMQLGTMTLANDYIAWTLYHSSGYDAYSPATVTNKITGSSLTIDTNAVRRYASGLMEHISKFYYVEVAEGGSHWIVGLSDNATKWFYTFSFSLITATAPAIFNGTGTILDGKTITSVAWNSGAGAFTYTDSDGTTYNLPVDPIGLVLSNTGVGALPLPGTATFPWGGTAQPNDEDKEVDIPFIPPVPYIPPVGLPNTGVGTGTGTIGIPVTDTMTNTQVKTDTAVDTGVLEKDVSIDLSTPQLIKDFISDIPDFFSGLFSWLPDDFEKKLEGVWAIFGVLIGMMVVVKIIDIIWP